MTNWMNGLTGRVLVLVAHADDESVGYGALLQKMREAVVVIATDGAPRDPYFWERFGSREAYAGVRRDEARKSMELAGVGELVLLAEEDSRLEDQRLFLNLGAAYSRLRELVERARPQAIATLAYEGGHPDHDSCSLLGARLGERFGLPVWEAPLYSREYEGSEIQLEADRGRAMNPHIRQLQADAGQGGTDVGHAGEVDSGSAGVMRLQRFVCETDEEYEVEIAPGELERKRKMCAVYVSQGDFLRTFDARREVVRPQVKYEYARAPHDGPVNYEQWQWWMTAQEVSAKFKEFLEAGN
jgi:LmbE family N-acetylglucosaminyl deacetylase